MRRSLVPLLIISAGFLAAGCGGSSSSSTKTVTVQQSEPLTKAQFIAQADAICQASQEDIQPLATRYRKVAKAARRSDQFQEVADVLHQLTGRAKEELTQLRELEPPTADQEVINNLLTTVDSQVTITDIYAEAVENEDQSQISTLADQITSVSAKARGMAQGYGLKVCGNEQ
jgi:hypothetical protein